MLAMLIMSEVPPKLTNGSVIPVSGISPMNAPIFSKIWYRIIATMPTIRNGPPRSLHSSAMRIIR
ncbi:hypothetical protein D3C86_2211670 [compost metagenome]